MKPVDSNVLPSPLTPADCDLQDFKFMPLDVARLRDSDMAAYESPEACWAAVLLWSTAWHQVPAASLPDDDRFLAKAAGYGRVVKEWANVREGALHGWIKCADGRLYHPVVAEKALESWRAKVHHQWKKECDRVRKANKQREAEGRPLLPLPPEPGINSDNIPQESAEIPPESKDDSAGKLEEADGNLLENALKGQGEGQGQGELTSKALSGGAYGSGREDDDDRLPPRPQHQGTTPDARAVAICTLLTGAGVRKVTAFHPDVAVTWAQDERVTDELLLAAVARAKESLGVEPFQVPYLRPIVVELLNPPAPKKPKTDTYAWKRTPQGIEAKGRELRMFARAGESHGDFAARIEAKLEEQQGRVA